MAVIFRPYLTNTQAISVQPWAGGRQRPLARFAATLGLWRRRIRERRALADLTQRELADFGATSADVYRELAAPFWRAQPPC
jgi:uncharacterized protein YjiS (DUF1127 family)